MSAETNTSGLKSGDKLDTTLVVLFLTALSYSVAFFYEAAYLGRFGVPIEYAEVSIKELLVCASVLLVGGFATVMLVDTALTFLHAQVPPIARPRLIAYVLLAIPAGTIPALDGEPIWVCMATFLIPVAYFFLDFVIPIFSHGDQPTYAARIDEAMRQEHSSPAQSALPLTGSFLGLLQGRMYLFAVGSTVALGLGHGAGVFEARTQRTFLVATNYDSCVIVQSLSEGLLCASLNESHRAVVGRYRFLKPEQVQASLERLAAVAENPVVAIDVPSTKEPIRSATPMVHSASQASRPTALPIQSVPRLDSHPSAPAD